MSKTVDERVVEMRFDNKNFEQNIQTSMSTLDKLKKSLHLDGAAKGLESVNNAAQKCNMSPLTNAVETVRVKFSALEVVAMTALTNITNSAINAGKNIVSAFTIDPIKSGFEEYETQINAVQTILANTSSKGTTLDQVNNALDELNHYADMTIYNFTEMTRNIGTFTAAGVDLDTSVSAIQGIANLAAVSGSNSQQASTAMYQLSQALAAGTVKLQDWNSVVNAGMGGQVFQDALKETAKVHGIAIDEMIADEGTFRETLSKGWLTSDILTETLSKFTKTGVAEYLSNLTGISKEQIETMQEQVGANKDGSASYEQLAESMAASGNITKEEALSLLQMADTAENAATKVKTFSQLFDTLKEAAQSGWTQSWEIIVGNFEQAKERLTKVSDILSGIINRASDRRNAILQGAFGSKWDTLTSKLSAAGIETETFQNKVKQLASSHNVDLDAMIEKEGSFEKALKKAFNDGTLDKGILKDAIKSLVNDITGATESTEKMTGQVAEYGEIVNRVINGEFGNGEARIKALTEAGYDYATVQNLVNEKLGNSVRHLSSLTEEQLKNADSLAALSDEQLKNKDYTDEQIEAIRDLAKQADEAGSSIDELINDFEKPSGAELLWDSILNVIDSVVNSLAAVKKAWNDTFHHGMTEDEIIKERSEKLYNLIAAINKFTEKLKITDDKAEKITRTFKGLFAIIDIITTITGGGLKLAFEGLSMILSAFDMDILDLTANIGDLLVKFHDFILDNNHLVEGLKIAKNALETVVILVKKWIDSFVSLPIVQRNIARFNEAFRNTFSSVKDYLGGGIERFNDFIERVKALDNITLADIGDIFKDFKDNVVDYFLDITGQFDGLTDAIKKFKDDVKKYFTGVGEDVDGLRAKIFEFVKSIKEKFSENIGIGEILSIGIGAGIIVFVKKIGDALETLSGPFNSIAGILSNFEAMLGSCSKAINAFALKTKSQALLNVAIAVGILAASLVALTLVDQSKLWSAVGALGALAGGLLAVSAAMGIIGKIGGNKGSASMLGIAASLLILVKTLKSMETLNSDNLWKNIGILGTMAVGLATIAGILGRFAPQLSKGTLALVGISVSLKILVSALKDIDNLQLNNMERSIEILIGAMGGLAILAIACGNIKMGSAVGILAIIIALKLFISAFDDIAKMDVGKMKSSMDTLIIIFGSFAALMVASKFAGTNAAKAGVGILAMSAALLLIAGTIKILATIDNEDLKKATDTIGKVLLLFAAVVVASNFAGTNAVKAGAMLVLMSGALLILAGVIVILKHLTPDGLDQALKTIATLEIMFAGLIAVSYLAKDCKSTLIIISTTIGLLAIALGALSMIDSENLKAATNAMSQVMLMFGILIASTALAKKANGTLIIMIGTVTVLAGILALLARLPVASVLGVAGALSVLLLSLSASMVIISNAGTVAPGAYLTLGVMTLVVAGLAAIIGVLAATNVSGVLEIAKGLSVLLLSLSASCLILSAVGATGPASFIGIAALSTLIVGVTGLMAGIGALATYYPGLEEFVNKGISLLEAVGYGLGSFFGNVVGGFLTSSTAGLVEVGANLSAFMENASPFFRSIQNIGDATLTGVKALAETVLILTAADILQGLTSWLTGGSSLSKFGEELVPFGEAMRDFSVAIGDLDGNVVANAATAGKALAEMASTIPNTGGLIGFFAGNNDMDEFGKQLVPFGKAMMEFGDAVDGLKANAVTEAAIAGKAMTEMAATIPNTGGVVSWFTGNNDIDTFGKKLVPFGKAMKDFGEAVNGLKAEAIVNSATAGKALMELASTVPNTGGLVSWFTGDNDLGKFGTQLVMFGASMLAYSVALTGIDPEAITNSTIAGKALVELANTLPNTGGLISWFTGDNDLGTFGDRLIEFGEGIKEYSDSVSGIDTGVMSSVITQVNRLVGMAKGMIDLDTSGMSGFSSALAKLGKAGIDEFINAFDNASSRVTTAATTMINTFINGANAQKGNLTTTFTSLVTEILTAIDNYQAQFNTAGSSLMVKLIGGIKLKDYETRNTFATILSACITTISNKYYEFQNAGTQCMVKLIAGVKSKEGEVRTAFTGSMDSAVSGIRDYYAQFEQAGAYLVDGFADGITQNMYKAEAKARAMARAAAEAAEEELDEHSPSKVGYRIGNFFGLGFVNAIDTYEDKAYDASANMAQSARTGLSNAIAKMKDTIGDGINAQPTIRPVLDLSDVTAKSSRLNSLFSRSQALSISTGIQAAQERKLQNEGGGQSASNSYNFTQNNYSPKALSRTEIYRQTKNQFSAMERMVEA